jgi:regulatory protein
MGKITGLKFNKTQKTVDVLIDGVFSFAIDSEIAAQFNIRTGISLSTAEIGEIREADLSKQCYDAALRLLAYRPRGETELKRRLHQRHFNDGVITLIIEQLKRQHLVDDEAFIQYWKENRVVSKPRSKRLIKQELVQKGVDSNMVAEALDDIDDEDNAYRAGKKRALYFARLGQEEFNKKMAGYLRLRGFSYSIIRSIVERLWQEVQPIS